MKSYLHAFLSETLESLYHRSQIGFALDIPQNEEHGDLSTNAAMLLSKDLKMKPRDVAEQIVSAFPRNEAIISDIQIAGPGFINFFFNPVYVADIVNEIFVNAQYGKSDKYSGKKANVEFVSANPTGPLTVGHGRNAVCGDTISNLLEWIGYTVDREYYFNNAGRQMRVLGDSVRLRYLALIGKDIEFPEDYYQGGYIADLAKELFNEYGSSLLDEPAEGKFKEKAEQTILADIKQSLERLGIVHSVFYNEHTLYEDGKIENLLNLFKEKKVSYEKDGAVWLKLSEMGNEADKVMVKSTGEPTYRLPDIAYHITKFDRGYDLMIDIFGSDHNATYPDVLAALKILGYPTERVKVLIHQFVTLMQGSEVLKMSTRKANYITLDELTEEVGKDVVRYFLNMRSVTSHMTFDIELAKKHSDDNPVFYLQYAHARICSIQRMAESESITPSLNHLEALLTNDEQRLLKKLHFFPQVVLMTAELLEIHKLPAYLMDVADAFHRFYTTCRIIGSPEDLAQARLALVIAVKTVIGNGLKILGVTAPEKM